MHFEQVPEISQSPSIYSSGPFFPPLLLPCILLLIPITAIKLFNIHFVSPEQHHGTEQVEIQPERQSSHKCPKSLVLLLFLLWSWTRARQGSSLWVPAWALTRLQVITSSCDNLVWFVHSPGCRWGFLNVGAKSLIVCHKPRNAEGRILLPSC